MQRLDEIGKPVLLALMVIGFIWFWPVGLAVLAYLIWSGRLGQHGFKAGMPWSLDFWSSGNTAFDAHREQVMRDLQKEKDDFAVFMREKLSEKDQAEFKEFTQKRRKAA